MATGRRWVLVMVAITVALAGLGIWRRATLMDERAAARVARRTTVMNLAATRRALVAATVRAGEIERSTAAVRDATTELVRVADRLTAEIRTLETTRDDAALAAWVAGGQVGLMRECLGGINRALNQASVGDPQSVRTLSGVRAACRSVGA